MGREKYSREDIISQEIRLVFDTFNIGELGNTEEELYDLRHEANDLETVEVESVKRILGNTDLSEEDTEFDEVVQEVIYSYYLVLHFVDFYIQAGDFPRLTDKGFGTAWRNISVLDKVTLIEMYVLLGDSMTIAYGVYIYLTQLENELELKDKE